MATVLCKNLRLSVEVEDTKDGEQLVLTLANDLKLQEVAICYPIGNGTTNRRYHRREAMVIAMRQLIGKALEEALILDSRGVSSILSSTMGEP